MFSKKSILFMGPEYHNSFVLRDAFRRLGWRADVLKYDNYPENLLYSHDCLSFWKVTSTAWPKFIKSFLNTILRFSQFIYFLLRYHNFSVYGSANIINITPSFLRKPLANRGISLDLTLLKLLGKKITYHPSGCNEEFLQSELSKKYPKICDNCGSRPFCDDVKNLRYRALTNRYGDLIVAASPMISERSRKELVRFRSLDLNLWNPELKVPEAFRLPPTSNLRIMHSFVDKGRLHGNKNIKGSPFVVEGVDQLIAEGLPVEYFFVNKVPARDMRYYQIQADIIVEQLIYGWWGSTGIETMCLGKPVVCFIHPEMKEAFFRAFPDYPELPIVEATTENITDVLRNLASDDAYRVEMGKRARQFAERHFDPDKNAAEHAQRLLAI